MADARHVVADLEEQIAATEAQARKADFAVTRTSDEGITYRQLPSQIEIVNLTDPILDPIRARRIRLHVKGRAFHHVSETPDGQWIYHADQ